MEHAQRESNKECDDYELVLVLILILMEHAQREDETFLYILQ